nr:hypothetical protein [uncultured Methanoregula sp.]
MIGICYPDKYVVEESFQLLKIPWEWYVPGNLYDVVIARKSEVPGYFGNLIDLNDNDFFNKISDLLNTGQPHLHEPACDILIDQLRQDLKKYTILIEIPPAPWGHQYLVALTHDVDVTSVRECRLLTAGYAAYQCFRQGNFRAGLQLLCARCGIGSDPWVLFERWKALEDGLGVRSTFFFVPGKDNPGVRAHPYRSVCYEINKDILHDLVKDGWETGVHGIDNWADTKQGKREMAAVGEGAFGNRTHWLLFDQDSWEKLDSAGYSYDTTFGYNDDAGFRAGTLQVYRPRHAQNLLELPLHIQDIGLFGKSCWAPAAGGWEQIPCLQLAEPEASVHCNRILDYARTYGGAVTLLWHYENITPPRDWSGMYGDLVNRAKNDGAWVTTAGNVVAWFKDRRTAGIEYVRNNNIITIRILNWKRSEVPERVRVHIDPQLIFSIDEEYVPGDMFVDIRCNKEEITVVLQ